MPVRTDEKWRFATVKAIDISSFTKPLPVADFARRELIARSTGLAQSAGRMIFANDQLLEREVLSEDAQAQGCDLGAD